MKECSKSIMRRRADPNFLTRYFVGEGIDIGGAPDPLAVYQPLFPSMGAVRVWDLEVGDAQHMAGIADESYDFVHSSHCLEHLRDPAMGLDNWFRNLRPGGFLVVAVPDEDMYEQGVFPSTFNSDHKRTFTICKRDSWSEWSRKEVAFGGRRPPPGRLTGAQFTLLTGIRMPSRGAAGPLQNEKLEAGMAAHRAGDLDAAAAAYAQILEAAPGHPDALHLAGLVRYQRRENEAARDLFETAIRENPNAAIYYSSLGQALVALNKGDEACRAFARAIHLDAGLIEAHTNLGATLTSRKKYQDAEIVLRKALEAAPDDVDVRTALARNALLQGETQAAADALRDILRSTSDHANAANNLGVALTLLGDTDGAEAAFETALANDAEHVDAHCNYAHHLLVKGDFARGWVHNEWRLQRPDIRRPYVPPMWDGESLEDGCILLWSEQVLGDAIQFVRYAPLVAERCGNVVVACKPPLMRLFRGVAGVGGTVDKGAIGDAANYDAHAPLLSLPFVFGTDWASIFATIPYLPVPDPLPIDAGAARLKVGLVWAGNPEHARDADRSRPLAEFQPLAECRDDVAFFSLQFGEAASQAPPPGMGLRSLVAPDFDFMDTAAAMAALDLVISVDTSAAHLAGALGLPVWLLLDAGPTGAGSTKAWIRPGIRPCACSAGGGTKPGNRFSYALPGRCGRFDFDHIS